MSMELFAFFIVLNIINVIIQTIKSIATVKCGKGVAALVNALAYGLYTVVLVYTVCELPLWIKVCVVGGSNLIGVFIVKWLEEKARKDRLWNIEFTTRFCNQSKIHEVLELENIPHRYITISPKHSVFNCYCETQKQSAFVRAVIEKYNAKYFVSESKIL